MISEPRGGAARLRSPEAYAKSASRVKTVSRARKWPPARAGGLKRNWRRGWDSNPRYPLGYNGFRDRPDRPLRHLSWVPAGGEGGIRTHGRVSPTHAFQACSLSHSDTSPGYISKKNRHAGALAEARILQESTKLRTGVRAARRRTGAVLARTRRRAHRRKLPVDD